MVKSTTYIERVIRAYTGIMLGIASLGRYELRRGVLQLMTPHIRLLTLLLLQASLAILENIVSILFISFLSVTLGLTSRVPLKEILRDALALALPLAIVISFPSLLIDASQDSIPKLDPSISWSKVEKVLTFMARVSTSTFNIVLFLSVTSMTSLLTALSSLRIPRSLLLLFQLTFTWIFITLRGIKDKILGFEARFKQRGITDFWRAQLRLLALQLIDSEGYAYNLRLAITSRKLSNTIYKQLSWKVNIYDLVFGAILVLVILIMLVDRGLLWTLW